jgi:phage terminase large subunit
MATINRRQFNKPVVTNKEKKVVRIKLPPAYKFLFKPYRYKSVYGGRGAARSWSIARALLALAAVKPLRILCTRELQTSISDSCYRLLCDQIAACHLSDQYLIQKNAIFSKCGSEFILNKGLRFNINEIKSMEGIDIVWIEEAQSVSEDSWQVLIPTIRKDNSEIWLSWNTGEETDPTYQRFVINKPPECISVHLTYKDNPYFPEVLNKERLWLKKVDSDAYDHIWEGLPLKISESIIFKGKYEEKEFEAPYGAKFYYGADWGFSNDPTVLLRCFECESNLYIDYGVHGVGVELDEIPALFDAVPNSRDSLIKADSARPETISYIKNKGFPIESCKKWNGSVQDGIAFLRSYNKIYIHPRCQFILDEFKHYSYKKDSKTGEILPVIIDKFNHAIDSLRYALEDRIKGETDWLAVVNG